MGYNLFLDDIRSLESTANYMHPDIATEYRTQKWEIVRNYEEFIKHINLNGVPDKVSFDHDLAEVHYNPDLRRESFEYYPETGYDCMKWMVRYIQDHKLKPPRIILHTMNEVGFDNMKNYYNNFLKHYQWDSKELDTPTDK